MKTNSIFIRCRRNERQNADRAGKKIGDNWYYFHEESDGNKGVLARRTKIGNYYVNSDGVWAK